MLSPSILVLLTLLASGLVAIAAFVWALWRGHLDELDAQARCVLEERDLRIERPWESSAERASRERTFGQLVRPGASEWGQAGDG